MKSNIIRTCLAAYFLFFGSLLFSESVPVNVPDAASLSNLPEDAPIARVLDQTIYLKDIDPAQAQIEKYSGDKTPEQLAEWRRQHQRSNLSQNFWVLFEQYAKRENIAVTDDDIILIVDTGRHLYRIPAF